MIRNYGYTRWGDFDGVPVKKVCDRTSKRKGLCDSCLTRKDGICYPDISENKSFWGGIEYSKQSPPKHENRTTRAMEAMCTGRCWIQNSLRCCCNDGSYVPFTARRGFKLTVAVKMGKLLKVMQKVRMLACGGNEEYNDLGDANMWGDVSDAVKSASSSVSSVATAVGKEAKKVSDTVSGSLLNIHGKLIRATILKYAGENNLGFICAVSSTTLSASAPTVIFLPKTSSNSSKTEDPIPHGNSLTSKMVLVARKLSSKRECPMCDKKATKGSAVEKWMPSTIYLPPSLTVS